MALPVVTYGKYNYGEYSNPTPVKYRGGIGEGLTRGFVAFTDANKKKQEQINTGV